MPQIQIISACPLERGRIRIAFDNGIDILLYRGEIQKLPQPESRNLLIPGAYISEELYHAILYEIIGLRAKKRAMFLLEQMDRTKRQLTDKLKQNEYPKICIDEAIAYVEKYHYLDDMRYAKNYVRTRQQKRSRRKLMMELLNKGVDKEIIATALEEEYESDEAVQIRQLLEKRHYTYDSNNQKEMRRTYQFLVRKGFRNSDIMRIMQVEFAE